MAASPTFFLVKAPPGASKPSPLPVYVLLSHVLRWFFQGLEMLPFDFSQTVAFVPCLFYMVPVWKR